MRLDCFAALAMTIISVTASREAPRQSRRYRIVAIS